MLLLSLYLFLRRRSEFHCLGDVAVSLAPVISGLLVIGAGMSVFDPMIAMAVASWTTWSTMKEIRNSGDQLRWPQDIHPVRALGEDAESA